MANALINIYAGNPTEGLTDGTILSSDQSYSSPLSLTLDAAIGETKIVKLAIRCQTGFATEGVTTISDFNDINERWKLCLTEDGEYADSIQIIDSIGDTNVIFYAKATSYTTEGPQRDRTTKFRSRVKIVAL